MIFHLTLESLKDENKTSIWFKLGKRRYCLDLSIQKEPKLWDAKKGDYIKHDVTTDHLLKVIVEELTRKGIAE